MTRPRPLRAPARSLALALSLLGGAVIAAAATLPAAGGESGEEHHYRDVVDLTFPAHADLARELDATGKGFIDDYHHGRSNLCGIHRATDVFGPHDAPVVAARSGEVAFAPRDEPAGNGGWMIRVHGDDGNTYDYVHLGRDDGEAEGAYVEGIERGARVERGEQIGYLGSSGNASVDNPHLHFEVRPTDSEGERARQVADSNEWECPYYNPHPSLEAAIARGDLVADGDLPDPDDPAEPPEDDEEHEDPDDGSGDDEPNDADDDGKGEADESEGEGDAAVDRLAGDTRVSTAAAIARATWSDSDAAVLAASDAVADALAAGPLAGALEAPLLTTPGDELASVAGETLADLGVDEVVLVGGEQVLSPAVADELAHEGLAVRRIAGTNRFATAAAVAEEVWERTGTDRAVLALGSHPEEARSWPDALAGGWLGAVRGHPVLLTAAEGVPAATLDAVAQAEVVQPVGGSSAIAETQLYQLAERTRVFAPLAGEDRYATSRAVADDTARVAGLGTSRTWLATGASYADALAAGPAAARGGDLLVLARPDAEPSDALRDWLDEHATTHVRLVGGTAALPADFEGALTTTLDR